MTHTKGGRGLKAPYSTTHIRVPVPVKEIVQVIVDRYKNTLDTDGLMALMHNLNDPGMPEISPESQNLLTVNEAVALAQDILSKKKSARVSMSKLLTGIYGQDIVL